MNFRFRIPPGDSSYEVRASRQIEEDTYLSSMMPHMHVRGKSAEYAVVHPDGRREVVLSVPRYDFNWQHFYVFAQPLDLDTIDSLDCTVRFDNSAENLANPDPAQFVTWGDQTWEEMLIALYEWSIPMPEQLTKG